MEVKIQSEHKMKLILDEDEVNSLLIICEGLVSRDKWRADEDRRTSIKLLELCEKFQSKIKGKY